MTVFSRTCGEVLPNTLFDHSFCTSLNDIGCTLFTIPKPLAFSLFILESNVVLKL